MQGEALLKIGGILEKLSNDISILKSNSIRYSGGANIKPTTRQKSRSRSRSAKRPILRSTSQRRKINNKPTKRISLKKTKRSSTKKNNKKR
jgi:hypothetical protein